MKFIKQVGEGEDRTQSIIGYVDVRYKYLRYIGFSVSAPSFIIIRLTYILGYIRKGFDRPNRIGITLFNTRIC